MIEEEPGPDGLVERRIAIKLKHAIPSENAFRMTCAKARSKGMKVNSLKTNVLCVNDALSYRPVAYIEDEEGERLALEPEGRLKVLGFHFGDTPTVRLHVQAIRSKFRQRFWTLFHLKKNGFSDEELLTVYKTCVRPVADYCDVVYHSLLTDELDEEMERMQDRALRCIYGAGISGRRMRAKSGISTLRARRIEHCDKFAAKCAASARFSKWFPLTTGRRSGRSGVWQEEYKETFARCERLRAFPVHFFRRRPNGKEGKSYGRRYSEYRE